MTPMTTWHDKDPSYKTIWGWSIWDPYYVHKSVHPRSWPMDTCCWPYIWTRNSEDGLQRILLSSSRVSSCKDTKIHIFDGLSTHKLQILMIFFWVISIHDSWTIEFPSDTCSWRCLFMNGYRNPVSWYRWDMGQKKQPWNHHIKQYEMLAAVCCSNKWTLKFELQR